MTKTATNARALLLLLAPLGCSGESAMSDDGSDGSDGGRPADARPADDDGPRPNIVYIVTDDLDLRSTAFMPKVKALVGDEGVTFENFFATYAVCCPSRSSVLTGKYPHNHHVVANSFPTGGFRKFKGSGSERSTVATWLEESGYHTALVGKYLNQYSTGDDPNYVPPGWSEWYGRSQGDGFYNYSLVENGVTVRYGEKPRAYGTDVLARKAVAFISRREEEDDRPFFLYIAPAAPHGPATAAPRHAALFAGVTYPHGPAWDEADVSDKPDWIQKKPRVDDGTRRKMNQLYRDRLRSLQAVDDLVESVVNALDAAGELDRTVLVFTSDNGFHIGEHRMGRGKRTAYEVDIRIPLMVRGPGIPRGATRAHWVLNIDLAATFAELAGAPAPETDGVSFRPLLGDAPPAADDWQRDFLVINRYAENDRDDEPDITAIRQGRYKYIESHIAGRELYDLMADPHELDSIHASADPALIASLRARMMDLLACSGAGCR